MCYGLRPRPQHYCQVGVCVEEWRITTTMADVGDLLLPDLYPVNPSWGSPEVAPFDWTAAEDY